MYLYLVQKYKLRTLLNEYAMAKATISIGLAFIMLDDFQRIESINRNYSGCKEVRHWKESSPVLRCNERLSKEILQCSLSVY